ncbi:MAG TPA: hypothetical protein VKN99_06870 [Polyangia bacterium]|nr:hypothetical protein [Polyangia bacterium]
MLRRSLLLVGLLLARRATAAAPPAPAAQVAVDFVPAGGEPRWLVLALEELVGREFARFHQIQVADKVDARACQRREPHCLIDRYRSLGVQVVVLGTLRDSTLEYQVYDTWTRARAFEGKLATSGTGVTGATLQRHIGEIVRPVVHRGGLLDQRPDAPAAEALSVRAAPAAAPRIDPLPFVVSALIVLVATPILFLWLLLGRRLLEVPPPGSWTLSAALVAGLAIALVMILTPGVRAALASHANLAEKLLLPIAGGTLWGLYVLVSVGVVFAPIHGLERVRHDALFSLLKPWLALCGLRLALLLIQVPVLTITPLLGRAIGWSERVTMMVVLPAAGLFAWLWLLTLADNLSTFLDTRLVDGPAHARNPWHRTIRKYFLGYVRRNGVELDRRLLERTLFLPSHLPHVLSYGGGLGRPRILVGVDSREAALGELPDESEAPERTVNPEELPFGMLTPRAGASHDRRWLKRARKADARRRELTLAPPRIRSAAPRLIGENATLLGWVMPHAQGIPLIANTRDDYDLVRQLLTEHYAAFRSVDDDDYDDTDPSQLDFLFGAILRELGNFRRGDGALVTIRQCLALAVPKASWFSGHVLRGAAAFYERFLSGPAATVGDAYAALNAGLHHLIQYLYTLREERLLPFLTARADAPRLIMNSKEILEEVALPKDPTAKPPLTRATRRRLLWLSQLFHSSLLAERRDRRLRWVGSLVFALVGLGLLFQATRAAIRYDATYVERMSKGAASDEPTRTR